MPKEDERKKENNMVQVVTDISWSQIKYALKDFVENNDGIFFCKDDARTLESLAKTIRRKLD